MRKEIIAVGLLVCVALAACGKREPEREESEQTEAAEGMEHAQITQAAATNVGIEVREAQPASIRDVLVLYGVVQANGERIRNVSARFPGVVRTVQRAMGETVKAGEVLATVESNDSLKTYSLTAPIGGVVTARNVNPGETVGEGTIFVVADLSTVWIDLALFPRDSQRVTPGQSVHVTAVQGEQSGTARLIWVSPLGTSENQSISVRAVLDNTTRQWAPGLYVTGEVLLGESEAAVTVASAALQTMEDRPVVFVEVPSGFEARAVKVGRTSGDLTEILDGLQAGERYAAANSFVIKAEIEKAGAEQDD